MKKDSIQVREEHLFPVPSMFNFYLGNVIKNIREFKCHPKKLTLRLNESVTVHCQVCRFLALTDIED